MLLLALLLLPMALRADVDTEWNFGRYIVRAYPDGTLKSIEPTCPNSSVNCSNFLNYKSYKSLNVSNLGPIHRYVPICREMDDHIFDKFDQLLYLILANNSLGVLPEFVFSNLTNLRYLNLADNEISSFDNEIFIGLKNLNYLNVSNNKLEILKKSYFSGIPQKTMINVKGNPLWKISTLTFQNSHELPEDIAKNNTKLISNDKVSENPPELPRHHILVSVCYEKNVLEEVTVNSVKKWVGFQLLNKCEGSLIINNVLFLKDFRIWRFTNNWYQIVDTVLVTKISIEFNDIRQITASMLKNFPKTVTTLDLTSNKLGSMEEGSIENMNSLETNITVLVLANNGLKSTGFIANLPSSLTELNLERNEIAEIATGSFSKLKRLSKLTLRDNKLTVLRNNDLRDLSSLEHLDLSSNDLRNIMSDAFLNLRSLGVLNLRDNQLYTLSRGTFRGFNNIRSINLGWNSLTDITGLFLNMPDTLSTVILDFNKIRALGVNSFVKGPTKILSLYRNKISRIETGAFDLPTLEELNLNWNELSDLSGDSFKGLSSLKRLTLRKNNIKEINWDFWKYLNNVELLDISGNTIKKLKNGNLSGMTKRKEGFVVVTDTPLETIEGGVFFNVSRQIDILLIWP